MKHRPSLSSSFSAVASVAVLAALTAAPAPAQQPTQTVVYDTTPRQADFIPPGTVIEDRAPQGWSHLVIKSTPRPGAGDVDALSESTFRLASMLVTSTLANVKAEQVGGQTRHYLDKVAVGVGASVNGRDVVLTPDTQRQLGADLGFLGRQVLSGAVDRLREVRVVARSRTFALMDTPATMLRGNRHRPVILRYAFLLDENTGTLASLVWLIDLDGSGRHAGAVGPVEWLPPNKVQTATLHVDRNEFTLGVPSERAFATLRPPQGVMQVAFPESLQAVAGQPQLEPAQAAALDMGLRAALRQAVQQRAN